MNSPKFHNTLTQKIEEIKTLEEGVLKMYVCGPTVYDRPHLGNARSIVVYDLIFRLFQKIYPKVIYARNITDIDDKINAAAKEKGISINELTSDIIQYFKNDIKALNVLDPTFEPRATENITEIIEMIKDLIKNGHAYESEGHVLFDVESYKDYGELSNRNIDEMIAGSRVEIATYKKNPLDFVLWKPASEDDDISSIFNSPWSKGRPGWHIECSAMSSKYLGKTFDIHGGGTDLQFPHHENEIAQSKCANKGAHYAKYWIHNGFLTVNGEKMSKSLKNFITVRELLEKDVNGLVIRFLLLSTHYRKPLDFNEKALSDAKKSLDKFYFEITTEDLENYQNYTGEITIIEDLCNDLNISKAIATLHNIAKSIKKSIPYQEQPTLESTKHELIASLDLLGLLDKSYLNKPTPKVDENYINQQIQARIKAKTDKNYQKADQIRQELLEKGIILEDNKDSTSWKKA